MTPDRGVNEGSRTAMASSMAAIILAAIKDLRAVPTAATIVVVFTVLEVACGTAVQ